MCFIMQKEKSYLYGFYIFFAEFGKDVKKNKTKQQTKRPLLMREKQKLL